MRPTYLKSGLLSLGSLVYSLGHLWTWGNDPITHAGTTINSQNFEKIITWNHLTIAVIAPKGDKSWLFQSFGDLQVLRYVWWGHTSVFRDAQGCKLVRLGTIFHFGGRWGVNFWEKSRSMDIKWNHLTVAVIAPRVENHDFFKNWGIAGSPECMMGHSFAFRDAQGYKLVRQGTTLHFWGR